MRKVSFLGANCANIEHILEETVEMEMKDLMILLI